MLFSVADPSAPDRTGRSARDYTAIKKLRYCQVLLSRPRAAGTHEMRYAGLSAELDAYMQSWTLLLILYVMKTGVFTTIVVNVVMCFPCFSFAQLDASVTVEFNQRWSQVSLWLAYSFCTTMNYGRTQVTKFVRKFAYKFWKAVGALLLRYPVYLLSGEGVKCRN